MGCDDSLIENQPKGGFASSLRGKTRGAVPLQFPFGTMETLPKMSGAERAALQNVMRERYAVHYSELFGAEEGYATEPKVKNDEDVDPNAPTPHW